MALALPPPKPPKEKPQRTSDAPPPTEPEDGCDR
jgi:hypothetical protein